jgi:hypothetical protein
MAKVQYLLKRAIATRHPGGREAAGRTAALQPPAPALPETLPKSESNFRKPQLS